jgi:hypothetical protein
MASNTRPPALPQLAEVNLPQPMDVQGGGIRLTCYAVNNYAKEIKHMNTTTKTPLVIAFVVVAVLFLLFGTGAMTGTTMNTGWMGMRWTVGNGMMGNGWMGGISWMWIPTLVTLGLGVLLGWILFAKKA